MYKKTAWIIIAVVNYLMLFLVFPHVVLELASETICTVGIVLWVILSAVIISLKNVQSKNFLLQAFPLYPLVMVYHPRGIYGIHTGGTLDFSPAWLDALVFVLFISFAQCLIGAITLRIRK